MTDIDFSKPPAQERYGNALEHDSVALDDKIREYVARCRSAADRAEYFVSPEAAASMFPEERVYRVIHEIEGSLARMARDLSSAMFHYAKTERFWRERQVPKGATVDDMREALVEIAGGRCCETPGCTPVNPMCDKRTAQAGLAGIYIDHSDTTRETPSQAPPNPLYSFSTHPLTTHECNPQCGPKPGSATIYHAIAGPGIPISFYAGMTRRGAKGGPNVEPIYHLVPSHDAGVSALPTWRYGLCDVNVYARHAMWEDLGRTSKFCPKCTRLGHKLLALANQPMVTP